MEIFNDKTFLIIISVVMIGAVIFLKIKDKKPKNGEIKKD